MNTNVKKCLFGGALIGAGLCSSAVAADVVWSTGFGTAYAGSVFNIDLLVGGGWNASSVEGSQTAHSTAGTFGFDILADDGYGAFARAYTNGHFTVSTDTTMLLSFDLTLTSQIYITGSLEGNVLAGSYSSSNSFEHIFLAGQLYSVAIAINSSLGPSTFTMEHTVNVVPLPPAAFGGLAMLAGLGAYRRVRRRE